MIKKLKLCKCGPDFEESGPFKMWIFNYGCI